MYDQRVDFTSFFQKPSMAMMQKAL